MDNGAGVGSSDALSLVSTLLADPKTVSRLMSVLSEYSAKGGSESEASERIEASDGAEDNMEKSEDAGGDGSVNNAEVLGRLSGVLSSISVPDGASKNSPIAKHTALLLAVKPYLSPRRAELIDELLRLGDLGEIFRALGGRGGG